MKLKNTTWILIALLTLLTALVWLAITVKSTLNKPTVPENLEKISKPLNPKLDTEIFIDLKSRL